MKTYRILLVDDNIEYAERVIQGLSRTFRIEHARNITESRACLQGNTPDLILLDIDLGMESGFDLAIDMRSSLKKTIPVIYLTGKTSSSDRITGYTLGADDFIQKTIDLVELEIRIKNVLGRHQKSSSYLEKYGVSVDLLTRKAFQLEGGTTKELNLSPTEFNILAFFLKHEGQALSRNQILDAVWGQKLNVTDRTIDTHIFSLRKKLDGGSRLIESVFGIGYRFADHQPELS